MRHRAVCALVQQGEPRIFIPAHLGAGPLVHVMVLIVPLPLVRG